MDIYDTTPLARRVPFWERSTGGFFIAERGAGSGLHVDQCLWSNVGRNWCGLKQFALWPWEERHSILEEAGQGAVFQMPLSETHVRLLGRAKVVTTLRPGDVWVFSGGQPHTALCAGDGLNVSAYESFVSLHEEAMRLLVGTNTKEGHAKGCMMDDGDLDELYEDVVDRMQDSMRAARMEGSAACSVEATSMHERILRCLSTGADVMRQHGMPYCRALWEQEDRGERYRAREESSPEDSSSDDGAASDGAASDIDYDGKDAPPGMEQGRVAEQGSLGKGAPSGMVQSSPTSHFLVDNGTLLADTLGLGYRRSARLKHHDGEHFAPWGTTIEGVSLGNGWVQRGERFLPTHLKGEEVLKKQ